MLSTMIKSICLIGFFITVITACDMKSNQENNTAKEEVQVEKPTWPSWITKDYVMGNFDPAAHPEFVLIASKYADREGLYLHQQVYKDFVSMWTDAKASGVSLVIRSATRNFEYQKGIWERKWTGETQLSDGTKASDVSDESARAKKILLYSSMPGTSRHHWGTDIDLNSFSNSYFSKGEGLKVYNWLVQNGHKYGFCQPYISKQDGRTGYEEEKWHWSYTPLSKDLTDFYKNNISERDIDGFLGSKVAEDVNMIHEYVLGINPQCL